MQRNVRLTTGSTLAQELLQEQLAKVGYYQSKIIPGLWTHVTRKKCFTDIPEEIIQEYKLKKLVMEAGYIYCEIRKGMYGLPQAA